MSNCVKTIWVDNCLAAAVLQIRLSPKKKIKNKQLLHLTTSKGLEKYVNWINEIHLYIKSSKTENIKLLKISNVF